MAYIGNPPAEAYTTTVKDSFSGNGSTVAFTLSRPSLTNDVRVVVENVIQDPTVAYSVSGTTLTFTSAPPSGTDNIYVVHLGPAVQTTVPPGEISAATTFASNVTVQGAFTSRGIDDNATSTAMTLDASGNLLVGKTDISINTQGVLFNPNFSHMSSTNDVPLALNRKSSEGEILNFRKDGTTVGSIASVSGDISIGTADTKVRFFDANDEIFPTTDNLTTLGRFDQRFKNLYLSGGVYLGGTGSANLLDDYEEGVWTPTATFSSVNAVTYTRQEASYTKIGRFVFCEISIIFEKNTSSGALSITGFPFNQSQTSSNDRGTGSFGYWSGCVGHPLFLMDSSTNQGVVRNGLVSVYNSGGNGNDLITEAQLSASTNFHMTVVYKTSS
jgi:hypothetical protein